MTPSTTIFATVIAFALGATFAFAFARLASGIGFTDNPDTGHKRHEKATPLLGGLAVLCATLSAIWLGWGSWDREIQVTLIAACAMCALGLVDDKLALKARTKFAGQLVICLPLSFALLPETSVSAFGWDLDLGYAMTGLVALWLLTTTNAVNLLDGLDGMVGAVSISICLSLSGLVLVTTGVPAGSLGTAYLPLFLGASLLGFLLINWHPAKMYLGDAGSLSVGLLLGVSTLKICRYDEAANFPTMVMVFAVPLVDLVCAMARRLLRGTSIAAADREHFHHRLERSGLSVPQVALFAAAISALCGLAAIAGTVLNIGGLSIAFCVLIFAGLAVGGFFGDDEVLLLTNWARLKLTGVPLIKSGRGSWRIDDAVIDDRSVALYGGMTLQRVDTATEPEVVFHVRAAADVLTDKDVDLIHQAIQKVPRVVVSRVEQSALQGQHPVEEPQPLSVPHPLRAAA